MKKSLHILSIFLLCLMLFSNTNSDNNSFDARINTYKQECKLAIKPARYEGSRVTYYAPAKEIQKKNVETFFILDTEYKLAFSGKECSTKLTVRVFDLNDSEKRTLLKEIKGVQGKNVAISSKDLTKVFHKKVNASERLKVAHVEYEIGPGSAKNEAVVMVVGYID